MKRSKWKGPYIPNSLYKWILKVSKTVSNRPKKIWARSAVILPSHLNIKFIVHNGKNFKQILVTKEKIYHRFGEFAPTRTFKILKNKK